MARYARLNCRLCRREGMKLFLKGTRCNGPKCPFARRSYAPGQHGQRRTKYSNYGIQLREKQKVKRMYGVLERQFRKYFAIASKSKGVTGKILLQLLERRLDNIIFRAGFAVSRDQARQIVRHNFIYVNNKRVNIPSYLIKKEEVITVAVKNPDKLKFIRENIQLSKERAIPIWLEVNPEKLETKINRLPEKEDIPLPIQEQLIVELYSK